MKSQYPYCIQVKNHVNLYQLKDGRFQPITAGALSSFMIGYDYILVENHIADIFKSIEIERVTYKPATIWSRSTNEEYSNYQEIVVNCHFTPSQINDLNLDGKRLMLMDKQYLFASPELKTILSESDLEIEFTQGLSQFG